MDFTTVSGILLGSILIVGAIVIGGGKGFILIPAMMITLGGTFAATLINFPWDKLRDLVAVVRNTFRSRLPKPVEMVTQMLEYAVIVKRDGYVALDSRMEEIDDEFMKRAVELMLAGTMPDDVRAILRNELFALQGRHDDGREVLTAMGTFAPAFGMIGTLIGLVQMLRQLDDPKQIGLGMSIALVTTFYGALAANLVFLPLAGKLEARDREEVLIRQIIIEGVASIQASDIPSITEDKLKAFLDPRTRHLVG